MLRFILCHHTVIACRLCVICIIDCVKINPYIKKDFYIGLDCKHFLLIGFDKKSPVNRLNYNIWKDYSGNLSKPKKNAKTRLIKYICSLKKRRQTNWWGSSAGKVTIFLVFGSVFIWSYLFMRISFFTLCFMLLTEKGLLCTHTCKHTFITWAFLFSFPFLSLWFSCFPFSIQNIINIMWKGAAFFSRTKSMSLWRIKKKHFLKSFHWNSNTLHKQRLLLK